LFSRETDAIEGKGFPRLSESGDGSLTGMVVQLEEGEADIATQSIEFAPFRVGKLTYLHATSDEKYGQIQVSWNKCKL